MRGGAMEMSHTEQSLQPRAIFIASSNVQPITQRALLKHAQRKNLVGQVGLVAKKRGGRHAVSRIEARAGLCSVDCWGRRSDAIDASARSVFRRVR